MAIPTPPTVTTKQAIGRRATSKVVAGRGPTITRIGPATIARERDINRPTATTATATATAIGQAATRHAPAPLPILLEAVDETATARRTAGRTTSITSMGQAATATMTAVGVINGAKSRKDRAMTGRAAGSAAAKATSDIATAIAIRGPAIRRGVSRLAI